MWRGIAATIEQAISDGTFPVGARLPSEHELARAHGASRPTVVQAMRWLVATGLVDRRQGIGTFVAATTAAPTSAHIVLVGTAGTGLRLLEDRPTLIRADATLRGQSVAEIAVETYGHPWKRAGDLLDWPVLTGASGWQGCQRVSHTSLTRLGGQVRLRVSTDVADEFTERRCRITLLLDPSVFSVEIERSTNWY